MDRSSMAANTLVVTLAAVLPLWVFGLEQVVPPFILMAGLVAILLGGGRLRVPPTAWVLLVVVLITLLSVSRISGFRSLAFFARGHFILVTGLVALVLAANAGSTRQGLERVMKGFVVFTLLVTAMMTGYFLGLLPEYFEVPFKGIFGEALQASDYFQGNILWRKIAVQESPLDGVSISRVSTVFLYPTLSGAVMLPLLTFSLAGLYVLPKGWRVWCWLAAGGAVAGVLATGGRSAILFAATILTAAAAWRFVGSRRGPALLFSVAATVLIAVVFVLWLPVGDSVVWKKLLLEYRAFSAQGRVDVYLESIGRLLERPLFGWGTQELASQKGWTYLRLGTHSELLNMAYRFGLLGFLGYLAVGATFGIWYLHRVSNLHAAPGESRRLDLMVLMGVGVVAIASNALVHMVHWDVNVYWISLGLVGFVHAVGHGPGPLASAAVRPAVAERPDGRMPARNGRQSTDKPLEARLLGVRVDLVTREDLDGIVERAVGESRPVVIGNFNLHGVVLHQRDPKLRSFYRLADYVHIDGMPLVWWAKFLGYPATRGHRVSYLDWLDSLMSRAAARSWKIFYLGSKPGVAARGTAILEQRYEGVRFAHHDGYFDAAPGSRENEDILRAINDFGPDLLMVGMGQPRQESWIVDHLEQLSTRVILTSGACIDYIAGTIPSPPRWLGKLGLEWLFRLASEPHRLASRYLIEPWRLLPLVYRDLRRRRPEDPSG